VFGSPILDVAFGLVFVFLVLSMLTSAIIEAINTVSARRAAFIRKWLNEQFGNTNLTDEFYDQPLIRSLGLKRLRRKRTDPSYIPRDIFVTSFARTVLADTVVDQNAATIDQITNEHVKKVFIALAGSAQATIESVRGKAEKWFDDSMERVAGAFKRWAQIVLWVVALTTAFALNADALSMARTLWTDSTVREVLTDQADDFINANENLPDEGLQDAVDRARGLGALPFGWTQCDDDPATTDQACNPGAAWPKGFEEWLLRIAGWFVTAAALTLGAPFWFDILKKVSNIRGGGQPPAKPDKPDNPAGDDPAPQAPPTPPPTPPMTPPTPPPAPPPTPLTTRPEPETPDEPVTGG
jgi:hypothetical protein